MKNHAAEKSLLVLMILVMLAVGASSCSSTEDARLSVWIDSPPDGVSLPEDVPVMVISHAFAREGIAEGVLYVDSAPYRRESPSEVGAQFSNFQFEWLPPGPGDYVLQVWVYDVLGEAGGPATVSIHVGTPLVIEFGDTNTPTPLITSTFTMTPTRVISLTPTPWVVSITPTLTRTPTPVPVVPASDTTPPPAPVPVVPADGLSLSCRAKQVLNWQPVQDPSGIAGYYVKLQWEQTAGNWVNVGGYGPLTDKQIEVSVNCGVGYRWRVRAEDGAGNVSSWSSFYHFGVDLP